MDSREEKRLRALLEGRLSAEKTRAFLDRMKDREDFREHLLFAANTAPTTGFTPGSDTRYRSYSIEEVMAARTARPARRLKILGFSVFMIVVLTMIGTAKAGKGDTAGDDVSILCRQAVDAGAPYLIHPQGARAALPRIYEIIAPSGTSAVVVRLRRDGAILHERRWLKDEAGAEFDAAEGTSGNETFPFVQVILPFPSSDEVSLTPGERYDFIARADDGPWSSPREFTVEK